MLDYLELIIKVLAIALVASVIATKTIDGLKVALGTEEKHTFNRVMAILVDALFATWLYFTIANETDYFTFAIVLVLTIAGANAIYNILHELETAKKEVVTTEYNLHEIDNNEVGEGLMNWNNVGLLPIADGGLTKAYGVKNTDGTIHKGVDFGWIDNPNCNIYAWQDGTVVDAENYKNGGERGEYVVIEHTYSDGKKRWSSYLHLLGGSLTVKVGDAVKMGQVIGKRGNTGKSNGTHLHLYLSEKTDKAYTYDTMKALCTFNPMGYLYIDKSLNTKLGASLNVLKPMPEKIEYPSPVERDTTKNQILIKHPNN